MWMIHFLKKWLYIFLTYQLILGKSTKYNQNLFTEKLILNVGLFLVAKTFFLFAVKQQIVHYKEYVVLPKKDTGCELTISKLLVYRNSLMVFKAYKLLWNFYPWSKFGKKSGVCKTKLPGRPGDKSKLEQKSGDLEPPEVWSISNIWTICIIIIGYTSSKGTCTIHSGKNIVPEPDPR